MGLRVLATGHQYAQADEADAAETITPGMLIALNSSAEAIKQSTTGKVPVRVALENEIFGKGIDDNWADGDRLVYANLQAGAEFYGLVAAAAPAIAYMDYLESDGAGGLKKVVLGSAAIAQAVLAVDNSGGSTAARIRAKVI